MIEFAYPYVFIALVLPFVFYFFLPPLKNMHGDALRIPFVPSLKRISVKNGIWQAPDIAHNRPSPKFWFLYLIFGLLTLAASRPQILGQPHLLENEGRDIMLVLDISTSMLDTDFSHGGYRLTRLDAVKKTVHDFVSKRANDRIGLILFGTRAYLQAPLTYDKAAVKDILYSMQAGMAGDSTSIGDALALALKHMRKEQKDNQVIILLTDGENNDGSLTLGQAIKLAKDENIKIYTIGVGSPNVFFKMLSVIGKSGLNEKELQTLANITKGEYFRASSSSDLQQIYQLIDQLEPSFQDERYIQEVKEIYYVPLICAWFLAAIMLFFQKRNNQ